MSQWVSLVSLDPYFIPSLTFPIGRVVLKRQTYKDLVVIPQSEVLALNILQRSGVSFI